MRRKNNRERAKTGEGKESLSERVCKCLGVTPDVLPRENMIEIRGRNYMMVYGGGKILVYTPEEIRLRLRKNCLAVKGRGLVCVSYHKEAVGIEGKISEISFCGED